jgi:hypothetical protein
MAFFHLCKSVHILEFTVFFFIHLALSLLLCAQKSRNVCGSGGGVVSGFRC